MHHGHLVPLRGVVPYQLFRLLGGVGDQPVRGTHDLGLADHPGGGLGGVTGGERGVLDLGHGVHGVHQGDAPALGGEPADMAGEPVVGVDQVVVAGAVAGPGPHHAVGEGAKLGGQLLLGQALVRTGVHMPYEDARGQLHGGRQGARRRPGEDLDLDAQGGELLGQLDDVDVHPAGVAGAGLVQRGGVHAEHRHPARTARYAGQPQPRRPRERAVGTTAEPGHVLAHCELPPWPGVRRASDPLQQCGPPIHFRTAARARTLPKSDLWADGRPLARTLDGMARRTSVPAASRPVGTVTRGTTNPNPPPPPPGAELRRTADPVAVDLGYGAAPWTAVELLGRLRTVRPDAQVVGIEIEPERVAAAQPYGGPGLDFVHGGFEVPLPGGQGRAPVLIRAANVLRQYDEEEVAAVWRRLCARLAPGGLLVEGTCDEIGRRHVWVALGPEGPRTVTFATRLGSLHTPSDLAERLPKALIHRNVPGEPVHAFLRDFDHAWACLLYT